MKNFAFFVVVSIAQLSCAAQADPPPADSSTAAPSSTVTACPQSCTPQDKRWIQIDRNTYSTRDAGHGLSMHKSMFLLPATWSEDYHGSSTELLFDISLKQYLFGAYGVPVYFAYSQKSFWQAYNSKKSKPFRESDYDPELFARWEFGNRGDSHYLGADFGFEHESNGEALPDSRSWNRIYVSPFLATDKHIVYWKWWWRIPEGEGKPPTDPQRDDNPDIHDYYGYSELHYEHRFGDDSVVMATGRLNPATGHGALNLQYALPITKSHNYSMLFYLWQGYGESLIDYNHSITRVGIGFMLPR